MEEINNFELWQSVRQHLRSLGKKDQKAFGLEKEIIVEKVLKKVINQDFHQNLRYIIFSSFSGITHLPKWVMAYRNEKYEEIACLYNDDNSLKENSLSELYLNSDARKILRIKVVDDNNFSLNQNQIITLSIPNDLIDRHSLSDPKDKKDEKDFQYYNYGDKPKRTISLSKPEKWELVRPLINLANPIGNLNINNKAHI